MAIDTAKVQHLLEQHTAASQRLEEAIREAGSAREALETAREDLRSALAPQSRSLFVGNAPWPTGKQVDTALAAAGLAAPGIAAGRSDLGALAREYGERVLHTITG